MKIYWDIQNRRLLSDVESGQRLTRLDWILRDQVPISLYICQPNTSGGYTVEAVPSGYSVVFGVKASYAGALLAHQSTWNETGTGESSVSAANVDLNTNEAIAAIGTEDELDALAEFTLRDTSGVDRDSTQVDCRLTQDVNRASQAAPSGAVSLLVEEFVHNGHKCLRLQNTDGETCGVFTPAGVTYP